LSYGSETSTINKRDAHTGRGTNEIFKTATQTGNKGPPNEIFFNNNNNNNNIY